MKTDMERLNLEEHPRARGENASLQYHYYAGAGTSPRTRGKRLIVNQQIISMRNIPAHAGKT